MMQLRIIILSILLMTINADTVLVQPGGGVAKGSHMLVTNIETRNPHEPMMQPAFEKAWAYLLSADYTK